MDTEVLLRPASTKVSGYETREAGFDLWTQYHHAGKGVAESQTDSIQTLQHDEDGDYTVTHKRRNNRGTFLNLLDHNQIVLNRRTGVGIVISFASIIKTLLMGAFMGAFFAGFGGMTTMLTKLNLAHSPAMGILTETQKWLKYAGAHGLPVDSLAGKLQHKMLAHLRPRHLAQYALMTVIGGGAGSFWLGSACTALSFFSVPDLLHKGTIIAKGLSLYARTVQEVAQDVAEYKETNDPMIIARRIEQATKLYQERCQKENAEWIATKLAVKKAAQQEASRLIEEEMRVFVPQDQRSTADALMRVIVQNMNRPVERAHHNSFEVARDVLAKSNLHVSDVVRGAQQVEGAFGKHLDTQTLDLAKLHFPTGLDKKFGVEIFTPRSMPPLFPQAKTLQNAFSLDKAVEMVEDVRRGIPPEMLSAVKGFASHVEGQLAR